MFLWAGLFNPERDGWIMNVFVNKKIILVPFLLACLGGEITYSYTFDNAMLESFGIENVDLSMFSGVSDQFSGEYLAQIEVNNNPLAYSHSVYFYHQNDESFLCVTAELVDLLPLKKSVANKILETSVYTTEMGDCYDLQSLDSAISITFDAGDQMLHLEMPQLYLENFDPSWVMPKMRDYGIAGLIFDYSLINAHSRMKHRDGIETRNTLRSYGNVGLNIDRFRFRANYQYDSKAQINKFDWNQIYAFTDIASLNAKLYAGEILSRTNVFDSVRLKGVTLFSDESMMPSYLQGYAPQITGVVSSNAIVTIKQYGAVIRSEQVSSGPFAISNLPSYINGTVDVEIEEEGSPRYTYQVDVSQVPFLTRKGHARYNANIGKLDTQYRHGLDTNLLSADLSYGLTNSLSLFGGIMGTSNKDYHALNMGVGLNLAALGALSFDVTHSRNQSDRSKVKKAKVIGLIMQSDLLLRPR